MDETRITNGDCELAAYRHALSLDQVLGAVVESASFRRLWQISFLGAIDYLAGSQDKQQPMRSRACHSLDVAALANLIASERGYDSETRQHLVLAALLHDIGHTPLSHSVEPYFKASLGVGHHELGMAIIDGENAGSRDLGRLLHQHFDTGFLKALIAGEAPVEQGGDLFASPINLDTIDGIWRTFTIMTGEPPRLSRSRIARAAFVGEQDAVTLDAFWQLKHRAYSELIHSPQGLAADSYAHAYFSSRHDRPEEEWAMATETDWKGHFAALFKNLAALTSVLPDELEGVQGYTARTYWIKHHEQGMRRYQVTKAPASMKLDFSAEAREAEGWQLSTHTPALTNTGSSARAR